MFTFTIPKKLRNYFIIKHIIIEKILLILLGFFISFLYPQLHPYKKSMRHFQ